MPWSFGVSLFCLSLEFAWPIEHWEFGVALATKYLSEAWLCM